MDGPDTNGSPLTAYYVTASPGGAIGSAHPPQTTAVVHGLTNGTAYTFTVVASNFLRRRRFPVLGGIGRGHQRYSRRPARPATPSDTTATVRWTVPVDNGSPITGYIVTPYNGFVALDAPPVNPTATTRPSPV